MKSTLAIIGLAVMGQNLARNFSRFFTTSVYNRTMSVTHEFIEKYGSETLRGYDTLVETISSLERPRKVMLMVKAGEPVDVVISDLIPLLDRGDIIIDGGNSYYRDTERRAELLRAHEIEYVGCGVSGGEEGALHGPSIMPGCSSQVWSEITLLLSPIAARDFRGHPCVTHIGSGASGNYVKMVHNGIEYAVMQMIAEAYETFRTIYGMSAPEIAEIFARYNTGVLDSYLIEITSKILSQKDSLTDGYLIDHIADHAGAKGTGLWTSIDALESGNSVSAIVEATFARMVSEKKPLRTTLASLYPRERSIKIPKEQMIAKMESTLYLGMLFAYAQGLALIRDRSLEYGWGVDISEVTRIWQGGCIIRSQILAFLTDAYREQKDVEHIFLLEHIASAIRKYLPDYQEVLSALINTSIPSPALSSGLEYFFQMTTENSSANLIAGQRDFFGAHTYRRTDRDGVFHTEWNPSLT